MGNNVYGSPQEPERPKPEPTPQKWIVFAVAEYRVGLPAASVLRVLQHSPSDRLSPMGLVQIGSHVIRAINLHQWLAPGRAPSSPFLLILRGLQQEPLGLWADSLPDVVAVPMAGLRSLPPSAGRSSQLLGLMSHTASLSGEDAPIFLLDISRVWNSPVPEAMAPPPSGLPQVEHYRC